VGACGQEKLSKIGGGKEKREIKVWGGVGPIATYGPSAQNTLERRKHRGHITERLKKKREPRLPQEEERVAGLWAGEIPH